MTIGRTALAAAVLVSGVAAAQSATSLSDKVYGKWGVDLAARDLNVRPGDDFDAYAGGTWAKNAVIPDDSAFAGPYQDLRRLSEARLKAIIQTSPATSQIGALYRSYMDSAVVEARGIAPLAADLVPIATAADRDALAVVVSEPGFATGPVQISIETDPADARRMAISLFQSGLTFPDRDYYLLDRFAKPRAALLPYVQRALELSGDTAAESHAASVVAFETEIAKLSYSRADSQDPAKSINPTTLSELAVDAPGLPWAGMLAAAGLPAASGQRIVLGERDAIRAIAALWAKTPLDTLKAWASFHLIDNAGRYLPKAFADNYDAFGNVVRGSKAAPTRERRGINLVDQRLGELIGREYVRRFFDPRRKAAMTTLALDVKAAMRLRLAANDWMTEATKAKALEKLDRMTVQVGYPDIWRDYSRLRIVPDDLYGNVRRSIVADWAWQRAMLGKPIDQRIWWMTPQTVNAYNAGQQLKIVFPAARLQPPFFGLDADPAVNYGGIGAIIGHELTHSFDDAGRQIDVNGNFKDWWSAADVAEFNRRIAVLGAQYDALEPLPGMFINGRLTMGENIADLGGLLAALDAYHASLGGKPAPVIDGLTGDQRFFLAYSQVRRERDADDYLRNLISSDEHAPSRFRVIGPLRNVDAWYAAFAVAPADRYYLPPDKRARIW